MTDTQEWIDKGKALADQATQGPWETDGREVTQHWSRPEPWQAIVDTEVSCMDFCYGGSAKGVERDEDAEFIAGARTRLPQALNALQAVHDLHQPVKFFGHSATWLRCTQGCPAWPCPTVQAIQNELERKEPEA